MIAAADPTKYGWWLTSRASAIVALLLIALSVILGLMMATKVLQKPRLNKLLMGLHEHIALAGLLAIAVHGLTLLGDRWLHPSLTNLVLPFSMDYRPLWTGLGVLAGELAVILGLSFYVRGRIGQKLWRKTHRFTVVVYVLGVAHALGSGTDASTQWFRILLLATVAPVLFLTILRVLQSRAPGSRQTSTLVGPGAAG